MKYYMNNVGYDSIKDAMEAFDELADGTKCRVTDRAFEVKGINGNTFNLLRLSTGMVENDLARWWVEDALEELECKGSDGVFPTTGNRVLGVESDESAATMKHYVAYRYYRVPARFDAEDDEQAKAMLDTIKIPHIEGAEYVGDLDLEEHDDDGRCVREVYR